jgi:hypothetical protein
VKSIVVIWWLALASAPFVAEAAPSRSPVKVVGCDRDFAVVDFCDARHVAALRAAVSKGRPDFNQTYVVVGVSEPDGNHLLSYAVVSPKNGLAVVLPFDYVGDFVDSTGRSTGRAATVKYQLASNKICFTGSIYSYRNTLENTTACYLLQKGGFVDSP